MATKSTFLPESIMIHDLMFEQNTKAKASISLFFTSHKFQNMYTIYKRMVYNRNATTHLGHAPLILHH